MNFAPELNPQEYIWRRWKRNPNTHFKKIEITTFCFENFWRQAGI
ncbi:hypothetical protein LEP1GSC073_1870 [Leptospira noguchii str. Cascata]|nr:hypothetical protein LEP1GSC073_1870 [Leptospira noguchii str. Cascata]